MLVAHRVGDTRDLAGRAPDEGEPDLGTHLDEAILDAAVSRMRPVVLAAATTILGLIPLLADVFFVNMSITIMAGLGFATVLTLVFVPTLYAMMFRIEAK